VPVSPSSPSRTLAISRPLTGLPPRPLRGCDSRAPPFQFEPPLLAAGMGMEGTEGRAAAGDKVIAPISRSYLGSPRGTVRIRAAAVTGRRVARVTGISPVASRAEGLERGAGVEGRHSKTPHTFERATGSAHDGQPSFFWRPLKRRPAAASRQRAIRVHLRASFPVRQSGAALEPQKPIQDLRPLRPIKKSDDASQGRDTRGSRFRIEVMAGRRNDMP
jgi:hypothetical protein